MNNISYDINLDIFYKYKNMMMRKHNLEKNPVDKRQKITYSEKEKRMIERDKIIIDNQILNNIDEEKSVIYDNQIEVASRIISALYKRKIFNIMVIAKTQSGKTGAMVAFIEKYVLDKHMDLIPTDNIYVITGLSSKEWVLQTRDRMPECLRKRVIHRNDLDKKKFINEIKDKKNVLIIMDEIQIAAKNKQSLNKVFDKIGFNHLQYFLKNDIKIVEFSATPDGTLYDLQKWKDHKKILLMEPGDGYISTYDLYEQGRVFQYKDLCGYESKNKININNPIKNITEIKNMIDKKYNTPMYHLIRTPNAIKQDIVINNFKKIYNNDDIIIKKYDQSSNEKINDILKIKPKKHTFIFIKEKLRCAITLCKKYLGILYERYTKSEANDSIIIQGLLGRCTGYDDNGETIIFTNISSIIKYEELWNSQFSNRSIIWKSSTTRKDKKKINTFNNPRNFNIDENNENIEKNIIVKGPFNSFNECKQYGIDNNIIPKKYGPREKKCNKNGFIETNLSGTKRILSEEMIYRYSHVTSGMGINKYCIRYGYTNINDPLSVKCWLLYHK